jgi:hypothetical protein
LKKFLLQAKKKVNPVDEDLFRLWAPGDVSQQIVVYQSLTKALF